VRRDANPAPTQGRLARACFLWHRASVELAHLDEVSRALAAPAPEGLTQAFESAARCLATTTLEALLQTPGAHPALTTLAALVHPASRPDHLGFIARPTSEASLVDAARAAGFGERHWTFPSTIVALELGARLGRASLATRVFKASGAAGVVEVFMPLEAPLEVVDAWIAEGIGSHLAIPLLRATDFPRAIALMTSAGFVAPRGLGDGPIGNPREQMFATYFD